MLFLILVPPVLWAVASILDKIVVRGENEDSKTGALLAMTGFLNLITALILVGWLQRTEQSLDLWNILPLVANSLTYFGAMCLFLEALRREDVSSVTPMFQSIPIFGYIGAFIFLGELPFWWQTIAIVLIVSGGFVLSVRHGVVRKRMLVYMILSCALLALNDVIFAEYGRRLDDMVAIFGDVLGKGLWTPILIAVPSYRRGFVEGLRTKFVLVAGSDFLAIVADFFFDWGKLIFPVAIVQATASTNPLFVFLGAIVLARFFPRVFRSELEGSLLVKTVGVILVVVGGMIVSFSTSPT